MPNHGSMGSRWKADGKQQGDKPVQGRPGAGVSMADMTCGSPSGPAARPPCTTIRARERMSLRPSRQTEGESAVCQFAVAEGQKW